MREYEMMVVLKTDLSEDALSSQLDTIKGWVETNGGSVANIDTWGRKRMAYPIDGDRDGYYLVYKLNMPTAAPVEIERNLSISESVLRYLIIREDD